MEDMKQKMLGFLVQGTVIEANRRAYEVDKNTTNRESH